MNDSRSEPNVGRLEELAGQDRIPTLTEIATPKTAADEPDAAPARREHAPTAPQAGKPADADPTPPVEPRMPGLFGDGDGDVAAADTPGPEAPAPAEAGPSAGPSETAGWPDFDQYDDFVSELVRQGEQPEPAETPAGSEAGAEAAPGRDAEPEMPVSHDDIEALADRVLDQLAPVLREAVTAALQDMLARRASKS